MKMLSFLVLIPFLLPGLAFSQQVIEGRYCYTYRQGESQEAARELTRTLAIRRAVESLPQYAKAVGASGDPALANDLIQMIHSGYMTDFKVVEHSEKGKTLCETINARVSPDLLAKALAGKAGKANRTIEDTGLDNNGCLKILRVAKQTDRYGARLMAVVMVLRPTGPLHTEALRNQRLCFKVIVDAFDSSGLPLGSESGFIHDSELQMVPGEMKALFFHAPPETKSFRAWLVGGLRDRGRTTHERPRESAPKAAVPGKTPQSSPREEAGLRTLKGVEAKETGGTFTARILTGGPIGRYGKFFMEQPPRLVIDLGGKWEEIEGNRIETGGDIVKRIRIGNHPAKLRIVLDLTARGAGASALVQQSPEGLTAVLKMDQ